MVPTAEEVAAYLPLGGEAPDSALAGRIASLLATAPLAPRSVHLRDGDRFLLCGTIGAEFDVWQRRLAVTSAGDALVAQAIGTAAVEKVMDETEAKLKSLLAEGERLLPRRSPGYGKIGLDANREITALLDTSRRIGVSITDSMALSPSKSVSAICEIVRSGPSGSEESAL